MANEWYVVRTQFQQERKARQGLSALSFDSWLPLARVDRFRGYRRGMDRSRCVRVERIVPLFPNYLFVAFDPETDLERWKSIFSIEYITTFLGYREGMGVPEHVRKDVMDVLQERLASFGEYFPLGSSRPYYAPNTLVQILFGPFRDRSAPVKADHGSRVEVILKLLGMELTKSLPRDCLALAS